MNLGRNVSILRELKGIKQEELGRLLGTTQQTISRLEQKTHIDDDMLIKIGEKLNVSVDTIKNFREESVIQSNNQQGGYVIGYQINPLDKIVELYEKIEKLNEEIYKLKSENENLKK
jgi:transcriptional regulator with XRE-family HTH domain